MRIDLHTHSDRSDGTDPPATLVAKAKAAGLDVVALTDHDTYAGWDEARAEAERIGIGLIVGAEISCRLEGRGVHLLAYLPDPTYPELSAELDRIRIARDARVPEILRRLHEHGIALEPADVVATARRATSLGRPHVADALVAGGYVGDRTEAFDRWLAEGRPGHVTKHAPTLPAAIELVRAAGGVPVIAHPRGRGSRAVMSDDRLAELATTGLAGIEVAHHDHDRRTQQELAALARDLDLIVTGASDHHGAGKVDHPLGVHLTEPEQYARLLEQARGRSAATGRPTPDAVAPVHPE